jgi:hypothetical protein
VTEITVRHFQSPYDPWVALFQSQYRVESARLSNWDYSASGWYFVTICTQKKACSFGRAGYRAIVLSEAGLIAATEMTGDAASRVST